MNTKAYMNKLFLNISVLIIIIITINYLMTSSMILECAKILLSVLLFA